MHRKLTVVLVAALTLGLAACGGGSKPLTRAQFRQRAEAVCRRVEHMKAGRARGMEGLITAFMARQSAREKGLESLNAPTSLDGTFAHYKDAASAQLDVFQRALDLVKKNPKSDLTALGKQNERLQKEMTRYAKGLGLRSCGA